MSGVTSTGLSCADGSDADLPAAPPWRRPAREEPLDSGLDDSLDVAPRLEVGTVGLGTGAFIQPDRDANPITESVISALTAAPPTAPDGFAAQLVPVERHFSCGTTRVTASFTILAPLAVVRC